MLVSNKVKIDYEAINPSMNNENSEIRIARVAVTGAFHVFLGKIISRAIGIIGGIILIRLFADPTKYGLLNIAIVFPGILLIFGDLGMEDAIIKYVSECIATGNRQNVKVFFYAGLLFKMIPNTILTIIGFFTAGIFANVLGKAYTAQLIQVASLLVLAWSIDSIARASLLAVDATKTYGFVLVLNELLLSAMPIVLVLYGMGVMGALIGMVAASLVTSITAMVISMFKINSISKQENEHKKGDEHSISIKEAFEKMLAFGLPLVLLHFINTGIGQYYNFMIARYCLPEDMGNYSIAKKAVNPIEYVAWPISLVMFPMFSKIPNDKKETLGKFFKYTVKYSSLVLLPTAMLIMIFAHPLVVLLFGKEYDLSWIYISLLSINSLLYGLSKVHMRKLLLSRGETRFVAILGAISAVTGITLSLALVPSYGVLGLIATNLTAGWPSYIIMLRKVSKKYNIKPPIKIVSKIYLSLMALGIVSLALVILIQNEIVLVPGVLAGLVTYLVCLTSIGAVKKVDINNLREMFKNSPVLGRIINIPLILLEKIAK